MAYEVKTARKSIASKQDQERIAKLPPDLKEVYDRLCMPVDTNISLDSVILSDENKQKIQDFLKELQYRDKLYKYGLEPMNRILMYGASGCGKTYLQKALQNYLGYTMLYIDISQALSDDSVQKNLQDIFRLANYMGNCVIMLDECDSIAWQRDQSATGDSGKIRRATNTVFQQLDQMDHSCVFIQATNMLHRLDNAFERRFNMKMAFYRPQLDMKIAIKKFMFPKFTLIDDVDAEAAKIVERRAKDNAKLSYYEIQVLVEKAMKRAILNDTDVVKMSDIYKDLAINMNMKVKFNTESDDPRIFNSPVRI